MTRMTLCCLAALTLAAAPALAQTAKPTTAPTAPSASSPQAAPTPGSDEWLRLRGETYHSAPESAQDPAEVSATAKLNEGIAARNAEAEATEAAEQSRFNTENQRWQDESSRANTARVQWESDVAAANAARDQYERDRAAHEAEVAACVASRRCAPPSPR